jgi:septal ring-binding cell division protein DamX
MKSLQTVLVLFIVILVIAIIGFTTRLSTAVHHKRDQKRSAERDRFSHNRDPPCPNPDTLTISAP